MTKKPQTILVVEDDDATQKLLETYLHWGGYKSISASDGKQGVEMAQTRKPALMVLDLMLPELHGVGVCQKVKADERTQAMKVLVVTVKGFGADREQAIEAGADAFMAKPVAREEFIATIDGLLGN